MNIDRSSSVTLLTLFFSPTGMEITLNPEFHEYLPTTPDEGFTVLIHSHGRVALKTTDSVFILPGYTTFVGLNVVR